MRAEPETMSKVIIERPETAGEIGVLTDEANNIRGRIRDRAFQLFEQSGEVRGNDSEHRIHAEKELLQFATPPCGLARVAVHVQ